MWYVLFITKLDIRKREDFLKFYTVTISDNFNMENVDALKRCESTESTIELGYMCPQEITGHKIWFS